MGQVRDGACAALLGDGRMLVTGGTDGSGAAAASTEFMDPLTGEFSAAPPMAIPHARHACAALPDGRVLVVGGVTTGGLLTGAAEIFDPASNSWAGAGVMSPALAGMAAAALPGGKVLITGGEDLSVDIASRIKNSAEIYDPETGLFSPVPAALREARKDHGAAALLDGKVWIGGGTGVKPAAEGVPAQAQELASVEIYDPSTSVFSDGTALAAPRGGFAAFTLPYNGQVLIAGGLSGGQPAGTALLYRAWASSYVAVGSMRQARSGAAGAGLKVDGYAVVAGGGELNSSELFGFNTVKTDKDDYAPGEPVTFSGAGWEPGEQVSITLSENPKTHADLVLFTTARADGTLDNPPTGFAPEHHDVGATFYATAVGATSGRQAQVKFTDAPKVGSVTVGSQLPSPVTAGSFATYTITVVRGSGGGSSGAFTAALSVTTTLPAGVTASFSPNPVVFASKEDSGAATLTLTTSGSTPASTSAFTVKAATSASDFATGGGTLVVEAACTAPAVTANPANLAVTYGNDATFSAAASGNPTPSVQWQVSADGGANFSDIGGATSTSITVTKPTVSMSGYKYRAVFTNTCGGTQTGTTNAATLTVTPATVTAGVTASDKTYDGTTAATITGRSLTGVFASDAVNLTGGTAAFVDKNVGNGKTVTGTGFSLSGADAGNYVLSPASATTTANITPLQITGSFTAQNKVYDGTTLATIATRSLSGVLGTDVVSLTGGTAAFVDKNVGDGKTVNGTGFSLSGADAGNYTLASASLTATGNITPASVGPVITAQNKVYDGTTAATITGRSLTGVFASDAVNLTGGTAAFVDKNVGNGKTVTGTGFSLSGADAGNYVLSPASATTTANITPLQITGSFTAQNKVYDGTTAATIATRSLSGVLGTDVVSLTGGAAAFVDKNVGDGKTVNGTGFSLGGADAGNYTLASASLTATGNITQRALTVSATGVNKVYDGTTNAAATLSDNRVTGDILDALSYASGSFADKNVGNGQRR